MYDGIGPAVNGGASYVGMLGTGGGVDAIGAVEPGEKQAHPAGAPPPTTGPPTIGAAITGAATAGPVMAGLSETGGVKFDG